MGSLSFSPAPLRSNAATANTGSFSFNSGSTLNSMLFGSDCGALNCALISEAAGFFINGDAFGLISFSYNRPGVNFAGLGDGDGRYRPAAGVPEPATRPLVGVGLAGIGFARRRRPN
jgi:hypothetical protein